MVHADASAAQSRQLVKVRRLKTLCVSFREFRMLKNWKKTKVTKAIVVATEAASCVSSPGASFRTMRVPAAMTIAEMMTADQRRFVRIGSSTGRGLRCITLATGESNANAIAGGPSMMMFTQRIAIAAKGLPPAMPNTEAARNSAANPIAVDNWKRTKETML